MASIRKLTNGSWQATIYVGRNEKGKMLRKYITRQTEKEAKRDAREIERSIEQNDISNLGLMKVSAYMDSWLEINRPYLASTTVRAYKMYIEKHFKPYFGNLKMEKVTDAHIKAYMAEKLQGLSPTTVRKHFFTLRKIFGEALKHNSPCVGLKAPKPNNYTPRIPTREEFEEIRSAFARMGAEEEVIILLAGWCGLRRGEIFALQWDDIDTKEGIITVDESMALSEEGYRFEPKKPKSDNSVRVVAAPDYLIERLGVLKQGRKVIQPGIFTMSPGIFDGLYRRTIKKKGLPAIRFHNLRHYHACILYENQVPDLYAAERMGHDIWVLKKIYQHLGLKKKNELDQQVKKFFD